MKVISILHFPFKLKVSYITKKILLTKIKCYIFLKLLPYTCVKFCLPKTFSPKLTTLFTPQVSNMHRFNVTYKLLIIKERRIYALFKKSTSQFLVFLHACNCYIPRRSQTKKLQLTPCPSPLEFF